MRSEFKLFCILSLFLTMGINAALAHDHSHAKSLKFIQNKAQWDQQIHYRSVFRSGQISLLKNSFAFNWYDTSDLDRIGEIVHTSDKSQFTEEDWLVDGHGYRVTFLGANEHPTLSGAHQLTEYYNYILGNDPAKWADHCAAFEKIHYENLYPGISAEVYSHEGQMKYDLLLSPGSDPSKIQLQYDGLDEMNLVAGRLVFNTSVNQIIEQAPIAYQEINGERQSVPCRYVLQGTVLSFAFPSGYNTAHPLVIDPVVVASTYSGSSVEIYGHTATYDDMGNIFAAGGGFSPGGLPITTGAFQTAYGGGRDICLNKYNETGSSLIYSTYLGGNSSDFPHSLVANAAGELYILGTSSSTDYPVTSTAYQSSIASTGGGGYYSFTDIVITKLSASGGAALGSSYIGGNDADGQNNIYVNYGDNFRGEIILDVGGNCYVASMSRSSDFPVTTGAFQSTLGGSQDGVIFKMNPDLSSLLFSTYIGGTGDDAVFGVIPDDAGGAYVCGSISGAALSGTTGAAYPTFIGGAQDAYLAHLDDAGSTMLAASYFGTTSGDQAYFIEADNNGNVYIMGQSYGTISATAGKYAGPTDGMYIAKFNPDLTTHEFTSTFGSIAPTAFLVDNCGFIYSAGHGGLGAVSGFDVTAGAIQSAPSGFYLLVLEPDATAINYGTYYGAGSSHVDGGTSRFDPRGIVYEATCTAGGFPTIAGAYSPNTVSGSWDIATFKIDFELSSLAAVASASPSTSGCAPFTVDFSNASYGSNQIWNFGDGSPSDTTLEPIHTFSSPGLYNVTLIVTDTTGCVTADTAFITIEVGSGVLANAAMVQSIDCETMSVTVAHAGSVSPDFESIWDFGDGSTYVGTYTVHPYAAPGIYDITLITNNITSCPNSDTTVTTIEILPNVDAAFNASPSTLGCAPFAVDFTNAGSGVAFEWGYGDGSPVETLASPNHTFTSGGTYEVMLVANDPSTCNLTDTATLEFLITDPIPVIADFVDSVDCATQTVFLTNESTSGTGIHYNWNMGDGTTYTDTHVVHPFSLPGTYNIILMAEDSLCGNSDVFTINIPMWQPRNLYLGEDDILCPDSSKILSSGMDNVTFLWSTGETTNTISVADSGQYWLTISDGTCEGFDTVDLAIAARLTPGYTADLCLGIPLELDAGPGTEYLWETGGTGRFLNVKSGGDYPVMVVDEYECIHFDTITVEELGTGVGPFIPNAFTPDGNGNNDEFLVTGFGYEQYELSIFDRWGRLTFQTQMVNKGWDGTLNASGEEAPEGVYCYRLTLINPCTNSTLENLTGSILLIR